MKEKILGTKKSKNVLNFKTYSSVDKFDSIMEKNKISKRKKRKRKHELNEPSSELKKKVKAEIAKDVIEHNNTKNVTNLKLHNSDFENNDNSDTSDHQDTQTEISKEENDKFNGKFLRNAFNSPEGLSILQKFVTISNSDNNDKDLAVEYLQAGGNILEILRLLDTPQKKNIYNLSVVFSAIHIIIIKILSRCPQYQSNAEEACRHLINSHLTSIHSMLSSQSKVKHRKIVLKLLAVIISLGGTLPRELLNHLSLHSQLIEVLVSHAKPTDSQSVRTCFIHFILAFLIDGNVSDIRALLEKRGVLSSIFSGLIYDYSDIVQLVLTTVKKYVLENLAISKTTKLHVFSTPVIQEIVKLYNWKGPKNWPGGKKEKLLTEDIDLEQKEVTVNVVHEFLVTLLTSNRYGIAFHDRSLGTDSNHKHNQLINTILQSMEKPWEHEKPSDLVVKILINCPDLIKSQFAYTEPFLVPRISKNWIAAIHFIKKIIININVENCLKLCSIDMNAMQSANAILNIVLSPLILKTAIIPSLENDNHIVHHEIINLTLVMIRKVESFIKAYENQNVNVTECSLFKNVLLEYILRYMPSFESILNIWMKAFSPKTEVQNSDIDIKYHLLTILNLLQAYCEICPDMLLTINAMDMQNKPIILLTALYNIKDINETELTLMKLKALKILLKSNTSDFSPNEKIFSVVLSNLITKVGDQNILFDFEIRQTINLLLNRYGVFEEYGQHEIEIWIDSITYLENLESKLEVANIIVKILKQIFENKERYISLIHKIEKMSEKEIIHVNKQENIFNDLCEKNIEEIKMVSPMLSATSISLLLYAMVQYMKEYSSEALEYYMSIILTHTLHCQISIATFIFLIKDLKIPVLKYLTSWNNNVSVSIKKPFKSKNIFCTMSKILINPCKDCKINVIKTQLCIQLAEDTEKYTLTNFEIKALLRMIIFYLTQTIQKTNEEELNIIVYEDLLLSILKIANETEIDSESTINDCAKWIFKHPNFLQYFEGIYKNKNSTKRKITKLFIEICKFFFDIKKQSLILKLMHPYQEKFITQINLSIEKLKKNNLRKEIEVHLELIQILKLDIKITIDLICTIMTLPKEKFLTLDKSTLSIWSYVIPKFLEQFLLEVRDNSGSFMSLNESVLKKLFYYMIELKIVNKQVNEWENNLYNYLLKFPHNISSVDEKIFTMLMRTEMTLSTKKILMLLVERNPKFIAIFIKCTNSNENMFQQKSFVLSILSSNLKNIWDQEFLKKLYKCYKSEIILFLTDCKRDEYVWITENVNAVAYLIKNSFDPKLCKEVCDTILSNGNKLDVVQEEHIRLYLELFKKSTEIKLDALKDFIQLLLHVTVTALKKDSKNLTKLDFLCKTLVDTITILKLEKDFIFEELNKNYFWPQFIRINLKLCLKVAKEDKNKTSSLLKALIAACDVAYRDNSGEEYVKTIFEMTTSHSEFVNIMLSNTSIKSDLTELLWILVRKNDSILLDTHIPLYLASYNATLSRSDQFLLKILQHYENNGIQLDNYRPYLWGNAAASHYSIKGETDTALWRQATTSQVLDLLIPEVVNNTIKNYPLERNWKGDFLNIINFKEQVYDPAFYLPVFTYLLAENNVVACHKVIHSGALALTLVACSSTCEKIRLAAFTIISRFYFHLEATSSKEKLLWINFIDTLRNGIVTTELSLENIRLNGFVANFLARTSMVMTQPLNPLYSPIQLFLMAKPALNINTIPELLQLYHSSGIDHQAHRHWILEIIRDGLKNDADMNVALRCVLFKMLFDFYTSTLSDKLTKNLILQIVRSGTKLVKSCTILLNGYALLPWVSIVVENLNKGDLESIEYIIDIVNNILNILHENKSKEIFHHLLLMKILLHLKSHFNKNLSIESFKNFLNVLNKTIINSTVCYVLTKHHMKNILDFSKHLLEDISECEAILQFGCKFVKKDYFESENNMSVQDSIHKLVITWSNYNKSNK